MSFCPHRTEGFCKPCYNRQYNADGRGIATYCLRVYGISLEQRDAMLAAQGGVCKNPTCAAPVVFQSPKGKGAKRRCAAVDHCHKTGKVRGILCFACNEKLGIFEKMLEWAPDYLDAAR